MGGKLLQPWLNACEMRLKFSENFALSADVAPNSIEYQKKGLYQNLKEFCSQIRLKTPDKMVFTAIWYYIRLEFRIY